MYIYIYLHIWVLIKFPLSGNGHPWWINKLLSQNFRELHVYLSRGPCWPTTDTSYEESFTTCQITPDNHGSLLDSLLNMQSKHRGIPSQGRLLLTSFFLQGILAHPLQHALWLSPALSHNFRGTFAKISLFTDPGHQQGVHWRKSEHQGPWCLALAKPHFWKLGYCIWSLFLETSKSIIRQWQRQVQGCASGPWRLAVAKPCLWKVGCYLWRVWLSTSTTTQGTEPEPKRNSLVPFPCRTPGGSGWQPFTYNDYDIQLSRNFREKNVTFANSKKICGGFQCNTHGFRNWNSLQGP